MPGPPDADDPELAEHSDVLLPVKVDASTSVDISVSLSSSVASLKLQIAAGSKPGDGRSIVDVSGHLVVAVVNGRQTALPDDLTVGEALLFAQVRVPALSLP
jgi:hypothetical protein